MHPFHSCSHHHETCEHTWFRREEIANSISHGIALGFAILGFLFLLLRAEKTHAEETLIACTIYSTCLIFTYLSSTLYHLVTGPRAKRVLRKFDHIAIYLTIAGSYTPFTLVTLNGPWGWSLFGITWGLAGVGTVFKLFYAGRFQLLSTIIYLVMGWLVLVAIVPIVNALPLGGMLWLLAGGIIYTLGVLFFMMETVPYAHTIWHFFVMIASLCHYIAIYFYVAVPPVGHVI